MKFSPLWYVIFGLTVIIILLLLFQPSRKPNGEKIQSLEYAIAISDQQKKDLEYKHKEDSIASAQKLAELNVKLVSKERQVVKLTSNLERLKANPVVIQVRDSIEEIEATFQAYDSLILAKDQQLAIQDSKILVLEDENKRITANFLERLELTEQNYIAQKAIAESYKKENRKVRRGIKALKVAVVVSSVGFLLLGSQL